MKKIKHLFSGIIVAFLALIFCQPAIAAEYNEIQISPSKSKTFELDGGDIESGSFNVNNIGTNAFDFSIEVTPFSIVDKFYNPDYDLETNYTKIAKWITYDVDKTHLNPGESATINYTINTPEDVPAGGQYAAITAAVTDTDGGNVNITGRVAYVIYARVNGITRLDGSILEMNIPGFLLGSPITASSIIENTGNIDFDADYSFSVLDAFSGQEVYSSANNKTNTYRVLPETKRLINFTWDGSPQLGVFRVKQTVKYSAHTNSSEKLVFVCPIWLLFIVILCLVFMVVWLISRAKARRRGF